jgi:phosphoribosylformylglycinamidine synthase subunit PurS
MLYYVYVAIERKEAILDPQGKATEHALTSLGFSNIKDTRIGKFVRLKVEANSTDEAREIGEQAAQKLLANPIMEVFTVIEVSEQPMMQKEQIAS